MPFARWKTFEACSLEMQKLGHNEESANAICASIEDRAKKGMLYKADDTALHILSKADDEELVVAGNASWDIVDPQRDQLTVQAQVKALEREFALPKEYQTVTVNHKEFKLGQPILSYTDRKGETHYSHVHEKGTYLIAQIRNDNLTTTKYYRDKIRKGNMTGYSVTALPLDFEIVKGEDGQSIRRVDDMEYHAVTLCEKGVTKPVNQRSNDVHVISKNEGVPKTDAQRAMSHYNLSSEAWEKLSEEQKRELIDELPPAGTRKKQGNTGVTKATKSSKPQQQNHIKDALSAEAILAKHGFVNDDRNLAKKLAIEKAIEDATK